jgi:chromosomal replication initiator protein
MNDAQKWKRILDYIKNEVSLSNFRAWFSQTELEQIDENSITMIVSSAFVKNQLVARYESLINNAVSSVLGKELQIIYKIDASKFKKAEKVDPEAEEDMFQVYSPTQSTQFSQLNPKYTLGNFVVGLTNNLAYAAAQAVVQNPGVSYNPLFIYGPSGVGKTHLMQGIGLELLKKNPGHKIMYASSERFMNDFVNSIQTKKTGDFRQKYRSCDVLLIDDIQFISGKDSLQEEFFHTFNELQGKNAQLVFTSDKAPNELEKLEGRLASRFSGGLMVDVQLPDFDTRVAILRAKMQEKGDFIPDETINLIAESVVSNTRELEGKLIQITQAAKLGNQQASPEFATRFLSMPRETKAAPLDANKIFGEVNQYFNVTTDDLTGPRRQKELVLPRQIAMFLMYKECGMPFERIGQLLGGRDHTTVMHGVDKISEAIKRDREIQRVVIEIKQHLIS